MECERAPASSGRNLEAKSPRTQLDTLMLVLTQHVGIDDGPWTWG